MENNINKRDPISSYMINMHESWEVIYWCKKFGCSKVELEAAVEAVGVSPEKVLYYLRRSKQQSHNQ